MLVDLADAITLLKSGEVVAIPTETVYGLAADASNTAAIQKVYATKQRPANNPLIVHINDADQVNNWASSFPPLAQKLAQAFWPGPLTLVLPAKDSVLSIVRAGEPTVALRVPNHPVALQLLKQSGLGLAAPSANRYTQLSPTTAAHVASGLGDSVAVLDGGACTVGIESTIVSVEGDSWRLLRHGMISEADIAALAGPQTAAENKPLPKVPGQHLLHYSPRTAMQLFDSRGVLLAAAEAFAQNHKSCAALLIGEGAKPACPVIALSTEPEAVAEQLYSALHELDGMKVDQLLVELPAKTAAWAAVLDRLTRAGYQG